MSSNDGRPVLITGGAGFVGSHIADRFVDDGYNVLVVDDLSTGSPEHLPERADFYQCSILDPATTRLIETERPRLLIHCAAQISVPLSMAKPYDDLEINLLGTSRLAEAARRSGVERFVFVSSGGAIYGETESPADETSIPQPQSYYGVHKLAAEFHVALSGVPYVILRPANIYGSRQRTDLEGGVIAIFVRNIRNEEPISIIGDGEQRRDFVHVRDVVNAVMASISLERNGTWNVSCGSATSINELATIVESLAGRQPWRRSLAARPGDVHQSWLNSKLLQRETGWTPEVSLQDGLNDLLRDAP